MTRSFITLCAALCFFSASAQESFTFSRQECIDYAQEHNLNVRNSRADIGIAQAELNESLGLGLPQISGDVSFNYNPILQQTPVPRAFITGDPTSTGFTNLSFVPDYQFNAGLSLKQLVFSSTYFIGLKAARMYLDLNQKNLSSTRAQVAAQVSRAYYAALVSERRLELLKLNIEQVRALLKDTEVLQQNGLAETVDVNRVQVSLNNLEAELQIAQGLQELSRNQLKFQMGMPQAAQLVLTDTLDTSNELLQTVKTDEKLRYEQRYEYQAALQGLALSKIDVKRYQSGYHPQLDLTASLGTLGFGTEPEQAIGIDNRYYSYSTIGLALSVPIFQGMINKARVDRAKVQLLKSENELEHLRNTLDLEYANARTNLENALRGIAIQERNVQLAQEVYRVQQTKYKQGVGTNLQVVDAETAYRQARTNYVNALLEVFLTQVDYEAALGTLYAE